MQFVKEESIVRRIWGSSDTILVIFAGSAAEFALNKAVDWLYYTGRLPSDPIGRLFSTVEYARLIVFSSQEKAEAAIKRISSIHTSVENSRGFKIPDWAYRDVLFMLIGYSISAFELLHRKLSVAEKEEVFSVFYRVGIGMELRGLPNNYDEFCKMREEHMKNDLAHSSFTDDLFLQYRKHLGDFRYRILRGTQAMLVPPRVKELTGLKDPLLMRFLLSCYKVGRVVGLDNVAKELLLPSQYKKRIKSLDVYAQK